MTSFIPETILVYVTSNPDDALGENIIKLPFLYALRTAYPKAKLTWVPGTGKAFYQTLLQPLVDGQIDEIVTDLDLPARWSKLFSFGSPMKNRSFDLIIDLQRNILRTLQLRRIPHKRFISPTWDWKFSSARPPEGQTPSPHESIRLVSFAAAAAGRPLDIPYDIPVPEKWRAEARSLLPEGRTYIGLAPGAGRQDSGKLWPLENYLAVGRDQIDKGRVPVVFLGPNEKNWVETIRNTLPEAIVPGFDDKPVTEGLLGPTLTVAMARHLSAAVANCAGTAHMLGTGGAPMVALYGPTNPKKYTPHGLRSITLRAQDFGGTNIISAIPVEAVIAAVEKQIAFQR